MSLETILTLYLATYRLTLLISKEAGPFDMMGRFRTWVGVKFDEHSRPYATGQVSEMVLCPYCLSVWVGICVTLIFVVALICGVEKYILWALLPFALSGLSVFLFRYVGV